MCVCVCVCVRVFCNVRVCVGVLVICILYFEGFLNLTEGFLTLTEVLTCICLTARSFRMTLVTAQVRDVTPGPCGSADCGGGGR
jgi:hypothetical protein